MLSSVAVWRQVRIAFGLILVKLDNLITFLCRKLAVLNTLHDSPAELVMKLIGVEADGFQCVG